MFETVLPETVFGPFPIVGGQHFHDAKIDRYYKDSLENASWEGGAKYRLCGATFEASPSPSSGVQDVLTPYARLLAKLALEFVSEGAHTQIFAATFLQGLDMFLIFCFNGFHDKMIDKPPLGTFSHRHV